MWGVYIIFYVSVQKQRQKPHKYRRLLLWNKNLTLYKSGMNINTYDSLFAYKIE